MSPAVDHTYHVRECALHLVSTIGVHIFIGLLQMQVLHLCVFVLLSSSESFKEFHWSRGFWFMLCNQNTFFCGRISMGFNVIQRYNGAKLCEASMEMDSCFQVEEKKQTKAEKSLVCRTVL